MNFPATPEEPAAIPPHLEQALGTRPVYVGKNRFDYLVEVENESSVRKMQPDFDLLAQIATRGVIVTSRAESHACDFVSRFFAPGAGIIEDPVTGSAHCCLGPFWSRRMGKNNFTAYQASARGGVVLVRVAGERVYLKGQAVTVLRGELV
jgi:PhzF family phenazine biosynthesis protein